MSTPFDSSTDSDDDPRRRPLFQLFRRRQGPPVPDTSAPLECRFSREVYVPIGILVMTGLGLQISLFWSPRGGGDFWGLTAMLTALFHLPNLFCIYWVERIRVRADEEGLCFRGLGKTRFVPWHDIEDFGWKMAAPGSKSQVALALLFIRGRRKPKHLSRNLTHYDALLERIPQNATHARVSSWQPLEARDEGEWPKTFVYRDVSGWKLVAAYVGFTFAFFALIFLPAATSPARSLSTLSTTWSGLTLGGRIAFVAMPFLVCGTYPLIILARFPAIKAARRFQGQRIIATREGLTFERESQSTFVAWSDIDRFELETLPGHFQLPQGVVHTKRDRYEFHTGIAKGRELKSLIAYRATNAQNSAWNYAAGGGEEILGGPRSLWRGEVVGVGPRIHHYRTRTNRAALFLGMVMFAPMPYFTMYGRFVNGAFKAPDLGDHIMFAVFFVLLFLPTLWGILAYYFSAVEVDDGGLKQRGIWGEKKLQWSQIKSAKFNGFGLEIRSDKQILRIGPVADFSYLCEEIERRSHIQIKRTKDFYIGA